MMILDTYCIYYLLGTRGGGDRWLGSLSSMRLESTRKARLDCPEFSLPIMDMTALRQVLAD